VVFLKDQKKKKIIYFFLQIRKKVLYLHPLRKRAKKFKEILEDVEKI